MQWVCRRKRKKNKKLKETQVAFGARDAEIPLFFLVSLLLRGFSACVLSPWSALFPFACNVKWVNWFYWVSLVNGDLLFWDLLVLFASSGLWICLCGFVLDIVMELCWDFAMDLLWFCFVVNDIMLILASSAVLFMSWILQSSFYSYLSNGFSGEDP